MNKMDKLVAYFCGLIFAGMISALVCDGIYGVREGPMLTRLVAAFAFGFLWMYFWRGILGQPLPHEMDRDKEGQ